MTGLFANELNREKDMPPLQLYWPEAKRDEALAAGAKFLRENGGRLKFRSGGWPGED